jgi:thiamine biosynthesis lipoprotein
MKRRLLSILISIFVIVVLSGFAIGKEIVISGRTMGTTYSIKAYGPFLTDVQLIKTSVEKQLKAINLSMSVFKKNSEISRFNRDSTTQMKVSEDFFSVLKTAEYIWKQSGGALDGTVSPLIEIWGFGRNKKKTVPTKEQIDTALKKTGFQNIKLYDGIIRKLKPGITLNLGSIAKGFAVDKVSSVLKKMGIDNFFVEIGGEIYVSGKKPGGTKWVIGINTPSKNASLKSYFRAMELQDQAIATSGDYRNFFQNGDKSYSHIINPNTGYPVSNDVVSVSIVAKNCTLADGLATSIMVMGVDKGIMLLNKLEDVEGLIVVKDKGNLKIYKTGNFILKK